eukprot:8363882-Lingulodinium_polyedra.AAC.1
MMRSNPPRGGAAACKSHPRALRARQKTGVRGASLCNVCETLHNDAIESTVRPRGGLQIARSRARHARTRKQARAWNARARD